MIAWPQGMYHYKKFSIPPTQTRVILKNIKKVHRRFALVCVGLKFFQIYQKIEKIILYLFGLARGYLKKIPKKFPKSPQNSLKNFLFCGFFLAVCFCAFFGKKLRNSLKNAFFVWISEKCVQKKHTGCIYYFWTKKVKYNKS